MKIANIEVPIHSLNANLKKRVGDRQGWPIPRDLGNLHPDLKQEKGNSK